MPPPTTSTSNCSLRKRSSAERRFVTDSIATSLEARLALGRRPRQVQQLRCALHETHGSPMFDEGRAVVRGVFGGEQFVEQASHSLTVGPYGGEELSCLSVVLCS